MRDLLLADRSRSKRFYVPSRAIQEMKLALQDHQTVNGIFSSSRSEKFPKNILLPCVEPAQYLTYCDVTALREKQLEAEIKEDAAKEQRKLFR